MPGPVYNDPLVTLTDESLTLARYYCPFGGSKTVRLEDIQGIEV